MPGSALKVLINAIDSATEAGPFPNLACMKIAAYHKAQGDEVALVGKGLAQQDSMPGPDRVYVSCIFDWNGAQAKGSRWMYPTAEFYIGGSGVDLETSLPPEIDSALPDYSIYDDRGVPGWPYAIGFSARGCNRKCPFCIVPKKEGRISLMGGLAIEQIICTAPEEAQKKLLLLDNNFIQNPGVRQDLQWLAEWGGKVNFSQGIDARVIERNPDIADLLVATKYMGRSFGRRMLTSAYDWSQLSNIITKVCEIFRNAGFNLRSNVQFYVLVNYNTPFETDLERVQHLRDEGTNAYVMIYDKKNCERKYRDLARWANSWPIFHTVEWVDYDRGRSRQIQQAAKS